MNHAETLIKVTEEYTLRPRTGDRVMCVLLCLSGNYSTSRFEFPASMELPLEITSIGLTLPPQA